MSASGQGFELKQTDKDEEGYLFVSTPTQLEPHQLLHKSIDSFIEKEKLPHTTFHQITRVTEKDPAKETPEQIRSFYFKKNKPGSAVSELEAVCAAFYRLLAPNHIPATYAIYDEKKDYIGVVSEEIPGFKPLKDDPLKESNLNMDYLTRNLTPDSPKKTTLTIKQLEQVDAQLLDLERKADALKKKEKYFIELRNKKKSALQEVRDAAKDEPGVELDDFKLKFPLRGSSTAKVLNALPETKADTFFAHDASAEPLEENFENSPIFKESKEISAKITDFYAHVLEKYKLTKTDIDNYRIVKGLAICLTTSYIFMEDDLHQKNFSKWGWRIDFDMSLWTILYYHKDSKLAYLRQPTSESKNPEENTFCVTQEDILNFPNLKHARPSYWPTHVSSPLKSLLSDALAILPLKTSAAENHFPDYTPKLFQQLIRHPIFEYHKLATMTKFIFSTRYIYEKLANLHMCKAYKAPLMKQILDLIVSRVDEFKRVLQTTPKFVNNFFKRESRLLLANLLEDLRAQGISLPTEEIREMELTRTNFETRGLMPAPSQLPIAEPVKTVTTPRRA